MRYRQGDTAIISKGGGHGSSRSTYMGGTAIYLATEKIIEKGRRVAAQALEAAEADIEFADGQFRVGGTDRVLDLLTVARIARESGMRSEDGDIGLDTPQEYIREAMTYPNGCHIAEVEIDPETGTVAVVRYAAVDDYGAIINPMVAEGQVHGAIAQGIGQALMEHAVYDAETGQLLSASFMDYTMPRAADLPLFDVTFNGTNCTTNPLGVKGCGEAGAVAAYPAVTSAIGDALASLNAIGDPNDSPAPPPPSGSGARSTAWPRAAAEPPRPTRKRSNVTYGGGKARINQLTLFGIYITLCYGTTPLYGCATDARRRLRGVGRSHAAGNPVPARGGSGVGQ